MSRSIIAAAVAGLVVLAGCGGTNEPSAPPTSQDALTTATTEPDVVDATTEAAPTTEEPEETATADGPPEMPEAAKEQTEAGAEAFVEHYIERLNFAYKTGEVGEIGSLATEDCDSCAALIEGVPEEGMGSDYLTMHAASAELLDGNARVTTDLEQLSGSGSGSGTLIFRLVPQEGAWLVDSITLVEK